MVNQNEVVMLLFCFGVFLFIIYNLCEFKRIPGWNLVLSAYVAFFTGVIFTVAESFIFPDVLNVLEHLLYLASSIILLIWCWKAFKAPQGNQ